MQIQTLEIVKQFKLTEIEPQNIYVIYTLNVYVYSVWMSDASFSYYSCKTLNASSWFRIILIPIMTKWLTKITNMFKIDVGR